MLNPILHVSAEMMLELALGLEPPIIVAKKYGYELSDFLKLQSMPGFNEQILNDRARLRDEGYTWQAKATLMNQELIRDLFIDAKAGMKPELKLELSKHLSDMTGARKPAAGAAQPSGPLFQINITIPENARGPTNVKALIEGQKAAAKPMVLDMTPSPPTLPPRPAHARGMPLSTDLVGTPLETCDA